MAEEAHSPEETSANFYSFAYSVVEQTIARLDSLNDLSEMDGLIMRLECLNIDYRFYKKHLTAFAIKQWLSNCKRVGYREIFIT